MTKTCKSVLRKVDKSCKPSEASDSLLNQPSPGIPTGLIGGNASPASALEKLAHDNGRDIKCNEPLAYTENAKLDINGKVYGLTRTANQNFWSAEFQIDLCNDVFFRILR